MSKSVSHAVSTREPYITPKGHRPKGRYMSRVDTACDTDFDILTCNVHYIIYFNHFFDNTCI